MTAKPFFDVYYQPGENPVFCYRSGLMVYEEMLTKGVLTARGYNAAGYPQNVLTNCPTRLDIGRFAEASAFDLEIGGASVNYGLKFVDFTTERTEDALRATLTLDSTVLPVRLRVHTLLDGTQMFTRFLTLENLSDVPMNVSRMGLLSGGMEIMGGTGMADRVHDAPHGDPSSCYSLGYFDDDEWGKEGDFAWHSLHPDTTAIDTRFNRDRYRHPLIFLRNNVLGTMWFCQIGWSGGCRFTVDYNAKRMNPVTALAFKAEITGYAPLLVLRPHESYDTPEVHMGVIQGDLDAAVNEMHDHIRKSVLNMPEADPSACLIGCGMGAEHDMSVETSKAFIDQFAGMGGEIFIIDAGWQNPPHREMEWFNFNGMNRPDPDRYPNGLAELSDYCHEKGMKFAMWIEIERLGSFSPMLKEHPEWRAKNVYGEQAPGLLNFANPEVAAWAEAELARMIEEYKLDLLRVDYNDSRVHYFGLQDTDAGRECISVRHFDAVYKMYQNLKKRFPHVIFENCAGGGGRTDLGHMKAFHHTWVSDWQKMPRSLLITGGMTMALPPERVDRLFAGMNCHHTGGFDAHMRNTMLGHMSLNVVAPAATYANPVQMEFIQHSIALYKNFIRPFLPGCKVFHPTPDASEARAAGYTALEIAAPDGGRGAYGVFTLPGCGEKTVTVIPRGIDAGRTYKVTLDNTRTSFTIPGRELLAGIAVCVPAALSSELVLYETVE